MSTWTSASYFYDKTITIATTTASSYVNGLLIEGETTSHNIPCDVQPTNSALVLEQYGFTTKSQYTVYFDPVDYVTTDSTVTYNGSDYEVEKVIDWDDYKMAFLVQVH